MNLTNSMKKFGIEQTFKYVYKDPETNLRKLMDWGDSFAKGSFPAQRALIRRIIEDENHPYHAYILHMFNDIDVSVMTKISENFFINAPPFSVAKHFCDIYIIFFKRIFKNSSIFLTIDNGLS